MAWLYLKEHGPNSVLPIIRNGIQRYNASTGAATGYHETVTHAYVRLIFAKMKSGPTLTTWEQFAAEHADLFDRVSPPTLRYYRRETLLSAEARANFVEPDLEPLP
jgi:hypothetical protein